MPAKAEFAGAVGGEVTGSGTFLTLTGGSRVLVDFGLYQGYGGNGRNKDLSKINTDNVSAIIVTHAHADHVGRLPLLNQLLKSNVPIYMTKATAEITKVALKDAARLFRHLYPPESVGNILKRIKTKEYDEVFKIDDNGAVATFRDAGHILGSAIAEIKDTDGKRYVFSGDLGNDSSSRILKPPTLIKKADYVFLESTYGDRLHPVEDPIEVLSEAVDFIKSTNGTLLIPAFSIDRTQVALHMLKIMRQKGLLRDKYGDEIPVHLDSPMASKVTKIYREFPWLLKEEIQEEGQPFSFYGMSEMPRKGRRDKDKGPKIKRGGPKIIVSASGMMTGGRISEHAINYLPSDKNALFLIGFAAQGTPAGAIMRGEKIIQIPRSIDGKFSLVPVDVRARVLRTQALSAHADQNQLVDWLSQIQDVKGVILNHGNQPAREALRQRIAEDLPAKRLWLPDHGTIIDFSQKEQAS